MLGLAAYSGAGMPGSASWPGCVVTGPTLAGGTDALVEPRRACGSGLPGGGRDLTDCAAMAISVFDLFPIGHRPVQLAHRGSDAGRAPLRAAAARRRSADAVGAGAGRAVRLARRHRPRARHRSGGGAGAGGRGSRRRSTREAADPPARRRCARTGRLRLAGAHEVALSTPTPTWSCTAARRCPSTPTACASRRLDERRGRGALRQREYYSVGGGFVVDEDEVGGRPDRPGRHPGAATRSPPAPSCSRAAPRPACRSAA